jgi:hypothetical protein
MESILWACDLVALVLLCRWAIAQDQATVRRKPVRRVE